MNGAQLAAVHAFEGEVQPGDEVRVAWSEHFKSMLGRVELVTGSHIDVTVTDAQGSDYMLNRTLRFPMVKHHTVWSCHNRVEPAGGYFHPEPLEFTALAEMPFFADESRLVA